MNGPLMELQAVFIIQNFNRGGDSNTIQPCQDRYAPLMREKDPR